MELRLADLEPAQRYRLLGSLIVPRPIAWVTTRSPGYPVNAAPISFFNLFGDDPPVVALGLGDGARPDGSPKDTQRNVLASGEAVIHLVDEPLLDAMVASASPLPADVGEPELLGLDLVPSVDVAVPRIAAAPVALEARLIDHKRYSKGYLFAVFEVLRAHLRDGLADPTTLKVDWSAYQPVGRLLGISYLRTHDRFDRPVPSPQALLDRQSGS
jgi:flavin reductase (DIM6/NTAB) family NADH-FMN oxidoreductase RutF